MYAIRSYYAASITKFDKPSMDMSMLVPLLVMAISFKLYYGAVVLMRARAEIVERERNARWVQDLVEQEAK